MVDDALKAFGRVDVLVSNSGVCEFAPLEAITEDSFHRLCNIDMLGVLLVTQAAAKYLPEGGSVINIGSGVTRFTPANSAVYTASKGAVDAVTGVLSRELGPRCIRVNSINPGMVEPEGTHTAGSSVRISRKGSLPECRSDGSATDEIAGIAVFLASKRSRWPTGETLIASGGLR